MSDDGKGSLREAESFKLNLHSWSGGEDLANLKLMYFFFTWRHRKTFHCLSCKQQFHIQVKCSRKNTETCGDRSTPVSAGVAQGEKLRAHRCSSEHQTIKGTHFPWAALMCTQTPTAAAETFPRRLHRAEHITEHSTSPEHSTAPEHSPLPNSSTTIMVLQAAAPEPSPAAEPSQSSWSQQL